MNVNDLKMFNYSNPPLIQLSRKKNVQALYVKEIGSIKQLEFIRSIKEKIERDGLTIEENTYPYDIEEPIKHSCLWYKGVFTPEHVITYLNFHNINYITFFENSPEFKSIKTISHYHIFHY